jgi:hypothetical protein
MALLRKKRGEEKSLYTLNSPASKERSIWREIAQVPATESIWYSLQPVTGSASRRSLFDPTNVK